MNSPQSTVHSPQQIPSTVDRKPSTQIEAGGNPNMEDYGGIKPRYRLYFNRATGNSWWCFELKSKLQWYKGEIIC